MKTKIAVGFCLLIAAMACTKEQSENKPIVNEPIYFPLTTGSYWVYNTYSIDSLNNAELISENDTLSIIGDTTINGYQYGVFYGKEYGFSDMKTNQYRRDSLGYIVDELGRILFSQNNFTDTLFSESLPNNLDTLFYTHSRMESIPYEINLYDGVFDSILNYKLTFIYWQETNKLTLSLNTYFAPNIGKILNQNCYAGLYLHEKSYFETRLVGYSIAK